MMFFNLATPVDLFQKMESDLEDIQQAPHVARFAFNFFVTAEHLPDWLSRRDLVRQHALLRVVSHLANGAKHFTLDPKRHRSVNAAESAKYAEDYVEDGYVDIFLMVHFSADERVEMGADSLDVRVLADRVLDFWRPYLPHTF